jgi:hypothetical protein
MNDRRWTDGELRQWLRRGDPAAEPHPPEAAALERIRSRMAAELRRSPERRPRLSWALASALAVALVLLAHREADRLPAAPAAPHPTPGLRPARQVHLVTAKGMRVFWTLDPDFRL